MRAGEPVPLEYAYLLIGERFGLWPPSIRRMPLSEVAWMRRVLGAEGAARALLEDLPDDEALIEEGDGDEGGEG